MSSCILQCFSLDNFLNLVEKYNLIQWNFAMLENQAFPTVIKNKIIKKK